MKLYLRIATLVLIAGAMAIGLFAMREASKPESRIIADERGKTVAVLNVARMGKDEVHVRELENKIRFLDYQTAVAYNKESKPDEAIIILKKLITDEESRTKPNETRRSRSYFEQAKYYDVLIASFQLKNDREGEMQAEQLRAALFAKAMDLKKREEQLEGHSVDLHAR